MQAEPLHSTNYHSGLQAINFGKSLKEIMKPKTSYMVLDLYACRISAGFPSPADDYVEKSLDLNDYLISHPAATFFFQVSGNSMIGAGIHHDDILVVDRSLKATHNSVIIADLNGELTIKRLKIEARGYVLVSENPNYPEIIITEEMGLIVWGVATSVIHKLT